MSEENDMSEEYNFVFSEKNMYKRPSDYIGRDWFEYASIIGRTRDSGCLENSNWEYIKHAFKDWLNDEESGIEIRKCNHWAVGWTEELMIKKTAPAYAIEKAYKILKKLEDYPILDEGLYDEYQMTFAEETWQGMSLRERQTALKQSGFEDWQSDYWEQSKFPPLGNDDGRLWEILTADCD